MLMVGEEDAGLQRKIRAYNRQVFEEFDADRTATAPAAHCKRETNMAGLPHHPSAINADSSGPPSSAETIPVRNWKRLLEIVLVVVSAAPLGFISLHFIRYFTPHGSGKQAFEEYWQSTFDYALIAAFVAFLIAGLITGFGSERLVRIARRAETLWALLLLSLFVMMLLGLA